jgi:two-component system LytT family response regulator
LQDVIFVEKVARKAVIHTPHGDYTTTEPLGSLEKKFDASFFRCHNSFIINVRQIEKIHPIADRIYHVSFYNCSQTATMGRKKLLELYEVMSKLQLFI